MDFIQEVEYYCKQENTSGALLITGAWGSGKTYFFEKILPHDPWFCNNTSIISLSLFGITSKEILDKKLKEKYLFKSLSIPEVSSETKGALSKLKPFFTKLIADLDIKASESGKELPLNSILGAAQSFASVWDNFVHIPSTDDNKKIVLIFDDFERCPMDMEELLGAINAYVEGSEIKTILITNEDYILEKEPIQKTYQIMKEKLVCRTIKYEPDFATVVEDIIQTYKTSVENYTLFLEDKKEYLLRFLQKHQNIRVLKSSIQDFERFYKIILSEKIDQQYHDELLSHYLSIDTAYIRKEAYDSQTKDHSDELFHTISLNYDAMQLWKEKGLWDEVLLRKQLSLYKLNTPARILLREENILNLDDKIFKEGIIELNQLIARNQFELSDYSNIFRILLDAQDYQLPISLNIEAIKSAIEYQIQEIKSGHITTLLPYGYSFKPEERALLIKNYPGIEPSIELLEYSGQYLPELRCRAQLINALKTNDKHIVQNNIHRFCGSFDKDFADAIYQYWSTLDRERYDFIRNFMRSFSNIENFVDTYKETIEGINHLIDLLHTEPSDSEPITSKTTKIFIEELSKKRQCLEKKHIDTHEQIKN